MRKIFFLSFLLLTGLATNTLAQETKAIVTNLAAYSKTDTVQGWKTSGLTGITFGQTSLHNWSAGGDNTISGDFVLKASANYLKKKWFWDNSLSLEYGLIYSSTSDWQKAADRIKLVSIGGHSISTKWAFSALLDFNTQFTKGYNYPDRNHYISSWMAPAYLNVALGLSYKPDKNYTLFISPLTERTTFVMNDSLSSIGAFGVDPGKKVKWETGAYLMASTNQTIAGNLSLISNLNLFTPYNDNFGNVNINWDLLLNWKLSKLFTANLNTTLRYYNDEIKKIQVKEIFGLGLTYKF
jgi:hypothetical protein